MRVAPSTHICGSITNPQKNKQLMEVKMEETKISSGELFKHYVLVNLSTQDNIDDYLSEIKSKYGIKFHDIYNCGIKEKNIAKLELYDLVSLNLIDLVVPLLYFVDSAESLKNNVIWSKVRDTENDIVIDINGDLYSLKELR